MEDEIDLRKYFGALIRHWRLIVGLAFVSGLVALLVSFLIQPTYEATALVVITKPVYQLQFDPRIQNLSADSLSSPSKAFPQLATSDDLAQQLLGQFRTKISNPGVTLAAFKDKLKATATVDPSLIQFSVQDQDANLAAEISNVWASDFVSYTNELYQQREIGATFFEAQAHDAKSKLENTEQALVDYQGRYDGNIINSKLQANLAEISDTLKTRELLTNLMANTGLLEDRLSAQSGASPANLAYDLSSLLMQVNSLNLVGTVPLQIQFTDAALLSSKSIDEQRSFLADLNQSLQARAKQVDAQIDALTPQVLSLQRDLQTANTELDRLTRERDVARDTYLTLAKKVTESQITAQDTGGQLRLASQAAAPTEPVSPRKGLNAILGGFLGLVLGVISAFVIEARRTSGEELANHTT